MGDVERWVSLDPTGRYTLVRERMAELEAEAAVERVMRATTDRPRTTPRVWLGRSLVRLGAALARDAEPVRLQARRS